MTASDGPGIWSRESLSIVLGHAISTVLVEIGLVKTPDHSRRLLRAMLRLSAEYALQMKVPLDVFVGAAAAAYQVEQDDLGSHPENWNGGDKA